MLRKEYPATLSIRSGVLVVVIGLLLLVALLIIYNVSRTGERNQKVVDEPDPKSIATMNDTQWFTHQESKKPIVSKSVLEPPTQPDSVSVKNTHLVTHVNIPSTLPSVSLADKLREAANQARITAMGIPIASNQLTPDSLSGGLSGIAEKLTQGLTGSQQNLSALNDFKGQGEKRNFLTEKTPASDEVLLSRVRPVVSPYELKAGTIIPGIMITGINSDLPGFITAQIRQSVYDTTTGNELLLPQGAKLLGRYDSQVAYGQERVLVVWQRIIFPNGESLNLEGMPGTDMSGYAGFTDKVNNHYLKIFSSVLLMSVMTSAAQLSQPEDNYNNQNPNVTQTMAASAGVNMANTMNAMTRKNLNIQPTLEIRPGYLFNIVVTKDIVFDKPYGGDS